MNSQAPINPNRFWQVNFGHLLTMGTILITLGSMYGSVAGRLEAHSEKIATLEVGYNHLQSEQATMAIQESAAAQDRIDLHKTIEDDFSRRLTKLEDRIDRR